MNARTHLKFKSGDVLVIGPEFEGHRSYNQSIFLVKKSDNLCGMEWIIQYGDKFMFDYICVYEHEMIKIGEL